MKKNILKYSIYNEMGPKYYSSIDPGEFERLKVYLS